MQLERLLDGVALLDVRGDAASCDVTHVAYATDDVRPGSLFCCLRGSRRDGHEFAPAAVARGAVGLLCERFVEVDRSVVQAVVGDSRAAMAQVAAGLHGRPSERLSVVGVTGTNGKTTTTQFLRAILEADGRPTGHIGTMTGARTTPEAPDLQAELAAFVAEGKVAAAIEVSSVGLAQRRVDAVRFAVAVFTNLSHDHLENHGSMDAYFAAKASLFTAARAAVGVVNADDPYGRRILDGETGSEGLPMRPFSMADATDLELGVGWSTFRFRGAAVRLPLDGAFNVSNALAAATAALELGVPAPVAADALSRMEVVPGHAEAVDAGQPFRVVVDYAHTPVALASVLEAARRATGPRGRVLAVFGCGGDRDPTKRAPMGAAAAAAADEVVVTSDNPRSEDPLAIIDQILEGISRRDGVTVEPDRRAAIAVVLRSAQAGDVVVIAGKGHETGQTIGDRVLPFDDRAVVLELLGAPAG